MTNKAKLAFEMLEQEMEVIPKDDQFRLIGGITWQQFVNAVNNGDLSSLPEGSYITSNGNTIEYGGGAWWGGELSNVTVYNNNSSGGSNWGGLANYFNDPYFMNSQFWGGSDYSSGSYSSGGYSGGGYYVSSSYVAGSISSTPSGGSIPPTDCVFKTLGWISAMMFGDQTHDSNYYEQYYNFTHPSSGNDIVYNYLTGFGGGVPPNQLMEFIKTFFNATDYSNASTQFLTNYVTNSAGNQELIGVYETFTGGLHMVNVTQINGTEVHFWDEQKQKEGFVDMSKMKSFIGITK